MVVRQKNGEGLYVRPNSVEFMEEEEEPQIELAI